MMTLSLTHAIGPVNLWARFYALKLQVKTVLVIFRVSILNCQMDMPPAAW